MPPRRQQGRDDPPSHYIALADIPAPYSAESGRMAEYAFRAGDRVPAHRVGKTVPRDLVRDPRRDDQEPDSGPGEEG
jgi:hypothetical protein